MYIYIYKLYIERDVNVNVNVTQIYIRLTCYTFSNIISLFQLYKHKYMYTHTRVLTSPER